MYGMRMAVRKDGFTVYLVPVKETQLSVIAENFSNMKVHMYTQQLFAQTLENEREWYNRMRTDTDHIVWGILPEGEEEIVGVTGLHKINNVAGTCTSGIVIFKTDWWGKGVASRTHLARTFFAAKYLSRNTIKSGVRTPNEASKKALERVGYTVTGIEPRTEFRNGIYIDSYTLIWINPERVDLLYPEGLPVQYKDGVERARSALVLASSCVQFE